MKDRLTQDKLSSFFDDIVQGLHEKGVFEDYDEPKGPEGPEERPPIYKITHHLDHEKNSNRRHHIGDQPFDATISGAVFADNTVRNPLQPSQREILDKTRSLQEAIKLYVPQDKFAAYVRYFSENLHLPENRKLLDKSFANMTEQLGFVVNTVEDYKLDTDDLEKFISLQTTQSRLDNMDSLLERQEQYYHKFPDGTPNRAAAMRGVGMVASSKNIHTAPEFPELLLSLAIFQAAHIGYREELQKAVDRGIETENASDRLLSDTEYENATSVVQESLRQFGAFLIFSGLLPMVVHEHEKLSRTPGMQMSEDEQVRQAITNGWKSFFKGQILRSDTLSNAPITSPDYESERLTMVCPATASQVDAG